MKNVVLQTESSVHQKVRKIKIGINRSRFNAKSPLTTMENIHESTLRFQSSPKDVIKEENEDVQTILHK